MHPMTDSEANEAWRQLRQEAAARASGHWPWLIRELAPAASEAIAAFERNPFHARGVTCPVHGTSNRNGRGDGFRCTKYFASDGQTVCQTCGLNRNGFETIAFVNRWSIGDAIKAVVDRLIPDHPFQPRSGIRLPPKPIPEAPVYRGPTPEEIAAADARNAQRLRDTWDEAVEITDPLAEPVRKYFQNRRITPVFGRFPNLRMHLALPWYDEDGKQGGVFPTLLALTTYPDGRRASIQRHYLTAQGEKAPVDPNKKLMSGLSTRPIAGSATQVDPAGPVLAVGEGLESVLAARALSGLPTWACHTANLLEDLLIPEETRYLVIFGDADRSWRGQEAANTLMQRARAEGKRAVVYVPPFTIPSDRKGVDWADPLEWHGYKEAKRMGLMDWVLRSLEEKLEADGLRLKDVQLPWARAA